MVDLHQHSIYSDGTSTPAELVERAVLLNLTAMALTDHDTTAGLDECGRLAAEAGVRFIPGVEFEAREGPHVLGYFGGRPGPAVAIAERDYRRFRIESLLIVLECLAKEGFEIDPDSVMERAASGTPHVSHVVAEMERLGYLSSLDRSVEEFALLFGPEGPAALPDVTENQWPVAELIQMLRDSGAAVVASLRDRDDAPVRGAAVLLIADPEGRAAETRGSWLHHRSFRQRKRTSSLGNVRFRGVPPGRVVVRARGLLSGIEERASVSEGQELRLEMQVR